MFLSVLRGSNIHAIFNQQLSRWLSMSELVFKKETFSIMGAAMEVHRTLGPGFLEAVYQQSLEIELSMQKIPFVAQPEVNIEYKNRTIKKVYIPDFICFDNILLEIKAMKALTLIEKAQMINYLKATGFKLGLLINFGAFGKLEWQRVVL